MGSGRWTRASDRARHRRIRVSDREEGPATVDDAGGTAELHWREWAV